MQGQNLLTNFNKFLTPLYASPNVVANAARINYYLEDVFSLGVSFLQMVGPFYSEELQAFNLNREGAKIEEAVKGLPLFH